jgi:hypothetical protein
VLLPLIIGAWLWVAWGTAGSQWARLAAICFAALYALASVPSASHLPRSPDPVRCSWRPEKKPVTVREPASGLRKLGGGHASEPGLPGLRLVLLVQNVAIGVAF